MKNLILSGVALLGLNLFMSSDGFGAEARGVLTARSCPYSCRTEGIPKAQCRDWREGNTCYVDDLRYGARGAAGYRVDTDGIIGKNEVPGPNTYRIQRERELDRQYYGGYYRDPFYPSSYRDDCRYGNRGRPPRISIYDVDKSGNFFDSKYKVQGVIEGSCIQEAALFENGRPIKPIEIPQTRDFQRFKFNITTRNLDNADIRVYSTDGSRDIVSLYR